MQAFSIDDLKSQHERLRDDTGLPIEGLETALNALESHPLKAQDEVALMNRVDTKYLLSVDLLLEALDKLRDEYSVLQIEENRIFTYQNTYFDSANLNYFLQHHNGKLNRHKVRYRRYAETDQGFLEVKFKTNKKRTIKQREMLSEVANATEEGRRFVETMLDANEVSNLRPALHVNYRRLTLMNNDRQSRLTIDLDLRFQKVNADEQIQLPLLALAELKQEHKGASNSFQQLMKKNRVKSSDFSKYCIGCCLTSDEHLKKNRFLSTLRRLAPFPPQTVSMSV